MRLFFAINFNDEIKQKLAALQSRLKENSLSGNFTKYENLHLTLVFLGEVAGNRIGALRKITENVTFSPFNLCIRGIGAFKRDGGDILWAGIDANKNLIELHRRLYAQVSSAGFEVEGRKFTPHLTLAREVRLRDDFNQVEFSRGTSAMNTRVSKISLMKSERINGRLTYIELI
jgi:2'-5' RNA ligase